MRSRLINALLRGLLLCGIAACSSPEPLDSSALAKADQVQRPIDRDDRHFIAQQQPLGSFAAQSYVPSLSAEILVSPEGLAVHAPKGSFALRATSLSRGMAQRMLGGAAQMNGKAPLLEETRLTLWQARDVVEWYHNGPRGLEHGFVIDDKPLGHGAAPLTVNVEVTGATPTLIARGRVARLSRAGRVVAHYSDLHAYDATGRQLPSSMAVADAQIRLTIEDAQARYPIVIDPLLWGEEQVVVPSDGMRTYRVALDGDWMLIGGHSSPTGNPYGTAYMFERVNDVWIEQQILTPQVTAGEEFSSFGHAVCIDGDWAMIAAANHDEPGLVNAGAVYFYQRTAGAWQQRLKLVDAVPQVSGRFGDRIALDEDVALITSQSPGRTGVPHAYVFERSGAAWSQAAELFVPPPYDADAGFGKYDVHVDGDWASISVEPPFLSAHYGALLLYQRGDGSWPLVQKFEGTEQAPFDSASAMRGDWLLAASTDDSVRSFQRNSLGVWEEKALIPTTGSGWGPYGTLALDPPFALFKPSPADRWSFYELSGGSWSPSSVVAGMPVLDHAALKGAWTVGSDQLGAHMFRTLLADGAPCNADTRCLSGFCVDGSCCDTRCSGDCEACGAVGEDGRCTPIAAGTTSRDKEGACDAEEACDGTSAACPQDESAKDGSTCDAGLCVEGMCLPAGGAGGEDGSSAAGGGPAASPCPDEGCDEVGGCGCELPGSSPSPPHAGWLIVLGLGAAASRRRRRDRV